MGGSFGFVSLALSLFLSLSASADNSPFKNLEELRRGLGLDSLAASSSSSSRSPRIVKVAILDKGFQGLEKEINRSLPARTAYLPGPIKAPPEMATDHGLRMAQMVAGLFSKDARRSEGLELRLYNVFGFSNFQAAISDLIRQHVDIVLYSEVWEYGGNLDGQGFINAEVDRALAAGVLWINAAGNFGSSTYNSEIHDSGEDNWIHLPERNNGVRLICKAPEGKKCPVKVVLSWNDFKDDSKEGTNKDLDLALTDDLLNIVQSSALKQSADRNENRPGFSKYPREIIGAELNSGTYYLRVKNSSRNFTTDDRMRITVDGENFEMPLADHNESLLVPADNAGVITVGAFDSDRSGRSVSLNKPEVLAPSSVFLNNGDEFRGSSNSAAFTAAAAAILKSQDGSLDRSRFLSQLQGFSWAQGSLSLNWLHFAPVNGNCFQPRDWPEAPAYVKQMIAAGGKLVQTNRGYRMIVPFDPIILQTDLVRQRPDDVIASTPQGMKVFPRGGPIPQAAIEVFQRPLETGLCQGSVNVVSGKILGF